MKKEISFKEYKTLKPEFLSFCSKFVKENPDQQKKVVEILAFLKELKKKDEYFFDLLYPWSLDPTEKEKMVFANGIIFVEVKADKNGKFVLNSFPFYLTKILSI